MENELHVTETDPILVLQEVGRSPGIQLRIIHVRMVTAGQILDKIVRAVERESGMATTDAGRVNHQMAIGMTSDQELPA